MSNVRARRRGSWAPMAALGVVIALTLTAAVIFRLHTGRPTQTFVALELPADDGGVQPLRFGGSALLVTDVVWTSWSVDRADGTGMLNRPGAQAIPVTFTLSSPRSACGRYFFTTLTWRQTHGGDDSGAFNLTPQLRRDGSGPCS
jgi:hypothetical protein